jgi:hypothetical protein
MTKWAEYTVIEVIDRRGMVYGGKLEAICHQHINNPQNANSY